MGKHKLYDESPKLEHDDKGKVHVKKSEPHTAGKEEKGVESENFPIHVRHAMERHAMNAKHEMEHGIHDASKAGDKKEMHSRHESERKGLHTKHEKEGMTSSAQSTVDEPVNKVEKGAKA